VLFVIFKKFWFLQYQITDFTGKSKHTTLDFSRRRGKNIYLMIRNFFRKKKRSKPLKLTFKFIQKKICEYFQKRSCKHLKTKRRAIYVKKIPRTLPEEFCSEIIPQIEITSFKYIKRYTGHLKHIFLLNDFSFFDNPTSSIYFNCKDTRSRVNFKLSSCVKALVVACKRRIHNYDELARRLSRDVELGKVCGFDHISSLGTNWVMDATYFGELIRLIGSRGLRAFFYKLRDECIKYGIIDGLVVSWDARPLKTNSNGKNLKNGTPSDPEAGWDIKNWGIVCFGYEESAIIDVKRGLPIDYHVYPGNWNDYMKFDDWFPRFLKNAAVRPRELHTDAGPDSKKINQAIKNAGISPYVRARKSRGEKLIEVSPGKYFRKEYIDPEVYDVLWKKANLRTGSERDFANKEAWYERRKMNTRGLEEAEIYVALVNITILLTALTAYKVGRPDLIRKPRAFAKL